MGRGHWFFEFASPRRSRQRAIYAGRWDASILLQGCKNRHDDAPRSLLIIFLAAATILPVLTALIGLVAGAIVRRARKSK